MAVINPSQPTVDVQVPVPTPAPMKKRPAPQPQPVMPQEQPTGETQPVPTNPDSGMQLPPMMPVAPPPQAIILPWSPPPKQRMARKYARREQLLALRRSVHQWINNLFNTDKPQPDFEGHEEAITHVLPKEDMTLYRNERVNDPGQYSNHTAWSINKREAEDFMPGIGRQLVSRMFSPEEILVSLPHLNYHLSKNGIRPLTQGVGQPNEVIVKPRQMSRKYAADDDLDFSTEAMNPEGTEPTGPKTPEEDITGRKRRQVLQQMLEAARKGHYDPAGMSPSDYIKDMEQGEKAAKPGEMQNELYDPFLEDNEEEPKQKCRAYRPYRGI